MRSSSVKTIVSAVSLTFTLIVAAPPAEARPSQPQRPSQSAPSMADRAQRAVRELMRRVFGISANEMPTEPIPGFVRRGTEKSEMPTEPIPAKP